ncbi:hypothetical protein QUF70_12680 [Desulfobacterales bacterium HSG17]|nr:hypothetical protein [Desulfobacterales bacterium HSG17]
MATRNITLNLPENIYIRLQQAAQATKQSLDQILLRVIQKGSPPGWDDIPAEYQADLAALERQDDTTLWHIARFHQNKADYNRYQDLLDKNSNETISNSEQNELNKLRGESDRFMICKAHAVALLQWRGHQIPPADRL